MSFPSMLDKLEPLQPKFRLLVVASSAKDHVAMILAAGPVLEEMGHVDGFEVHFTNDVSKINAAYLANFDSFLMLHLAPFEMTHDQQQALQSFIESGKGWIGVHAAGLTGKEFLEPSAIYWEWFETFMGGVTYSPHPAYQRGVAIVDDLGHPITRGLSAKFEIDDEWYEYNKSPRENVHVLVTADESSYRQNKPMGDHPIVWVISKYRRAVFIGLGHDPSCLENRNYLQLLRNAIAWCGAK